ncbi:MAG: hypothetical protein IPM51_11670 [Sphingobacteriaceae bacterium]|nr:hypothetical protein [Sphingobacteriaceae bacterium]
MDLLSKIVAIGSSIKHTISRSYNYLNFVTKITDDYVQYTFTILINGKKLKWEVCLPINEINSVINFDIYKNAVIERLLESLKSL